MNAPIPSTMQAAVLVEPGKVEIEERPVPQPDRDEVLVQVAACGVCGSDVHYFRHGRIGDFVVERPLILGHEASGVIVAVGSDVSDDRIGQRVSIEPQRPSGMSPEVMAGAYNLDPGMRFFATPPVDGAFCEYVTIQSHFAWDVPEGISDNAAALFEPLSVAIAASRKARLRAGESVLVTGAGPIGLLCVQVARASGGARIVVSDIATDRLEAALRFGATEVLVAREPRADDLDGFDVFFEASGASQAIGTGLHALRPLGRAVLIGLGSDDVSIPLSVVQNRELELHGIFRYANTCATARSLVERRLVDLDALVTREISLAETAHGLATAHEPGSIKTMIKPSP